MAGIPFPKKLRLEHETYENPANVFHVVMRAMPGTQPFHGPVGQETWQLVENEHSRSSIELLAACFMPDHLHLLLKPRDRSIIRWANGFKSYSTRLSWAHRQRTALWQPGFYDRVLRDEAEFVATVEYIRNNPAGAGLTEWPWLWP